MRKITIFLSRKNITSKKILNFSWWIYGSIFVLILIFVLKYTISPKFTIHFNHGTYWVLITICNIWSIFSIMYHRKKRRFVDEYRKELSHYEKVVCAWKDDDFQLGKIYVIDDSFSSPERGLWYLDQKFVSDDQVFKFTSIKENRKNKLKHLC